MSDDAPRKKEEASGSPAWVMTFADLMSLLMCFFVLLLSFSEMDLSKYKQVAGSMKNAFGVQREIKTMDMPKGTSIIAREFSPGRPSPTVLNVVKQNTIDDTKQTLEFTDAMTHKEDGEEMEAGLDGSGSENTPVQRQDEKEIIAKIVEELIESGVTPELLENFSLAANTDPQTAADAGELLKALAEEVEKGIVNIGTEGQKILIRIREKGSFPSGSATFRFDFLPVLDKLRASLQLVEGRIIIAGHTDNIPINTARFRSNWELSSARGVSVVHELLKEKALNAARFVVEGHGDAHPLAPNDSRENRALNRRVELTIVQGEDSDSGDMHSVDDNIAQDHNQTDDNHDEIQLISEVDPFTQENKVNPESLAKISDKPDKVTEIQPTQFIKPGVIVDTQETAEETKKQISQDSGKKPAPKEMSQTAIDQKALEERIKRFSEKTNKLK